MAFLDLLYYFPARGAAESGFLRPATVARLAVAPRTEGDLDAAGQAARGVEQHVHEGA